MKKNGFKQVRLTNDLIPHFVKSDTAAIAITAGGGMGEPGAVVVYCRSGQETIAVSGNYVYGDVDMDLLGGTLGCFGENNPDWAEFYMGSGNSLLVNRTEFPVLAQRFTGKYDDEVGAIHRKEILKALSQGKTGWEGRKQVNREIASETLHIIEDGFYMIDGENHELALGRDWIREVELYPPDTVEELVDNDDGYLDNKKIEFPKCEYMVVNMDSFAANYRFALSDRALVMNFASAMHPGGGFLNGASAQEESLCRNSTLYASIGSPKAAKMYKYNKKNDDPFYSDYMLISPYVTVFREVSGKLTPNQFNTAVVTVPAVNLKRLPKDADRKRIPAIMEYRIEAMLCAALRRNYDTLILGAWGCGAFGHDAGDVAEYFKDALVNMEYFKYFRKIIFAVYDNGKEAYNYNSFVKVFGDRGEWHNTLAK